MLIPFHTKVDSLRGDEELTLGKATRRGNNEDLMDLWYLMKLNGTFWNMLKAVIKAYIHSVTFSQWAPKQFPCELT